MIFRERAVGALAGVMETAVWGAVAIGLAYFIARDAWVLAAGLVGGLALTVGALYAYRGMVLGLLLAIPSIFVPIDGFLKASGIPVITADRVLMGFLVGVLAIRAIFGRVRIPRPSPLELRMLILLVIVVISFASTVPRKSSADLYQGLVLIIQAFLMPYAGYLLARTMNWSEGQIRHLLWLLALLGSYLVLVGVVQYFFGFTYLTPTYLQVGLKTGRATGGFFSPLEYGQVLACTMLFCLLLYSWSRDAMARAILLGMTGLAVGGIGLCLTRAQWLAAVVALAWMGWRMPRLRTLLATGAVMAVVAGIIALVALEKVDTLERRISDISPIYNRLALWSTAANMALQNPLLGVGFGFRTFNDVKHEYVVTVGTAGLSKFALEPGVPHNEFLHMLAMTGIVGFAAYLLTYFYAFKMVRRCERGRADSGEVFADLAIVVQAILLIFFVSGMFAEMYYFKYFLTLMFFFLGIISSREDSLSETHDGWPNRA